MNIIPIACTNINWEYFVNKCNTYIGRSPTRALDNNNIPVGSLDSFLSTLDEFKNKDSNPRKTSELSLNHVSISFLMVMDRWIYYSMLESIHRNIHIIKCEELKEQYQIVIITSGTLKEWKESIINFQDYPEWSKEIWDILHKLGFERIFSKYKINSLNRIEKR